MRRTVMNGERAAERSKMVAVQIEDRGVAEAKVLAAMRKVPRHLFVPPELRRSAYADEPLPIGHGQTISQPYIVAAMTEALGLRETDRVLEVGTGSGYQTAILAEIVLRVWTVEIVAALTAAAMETLGVLGYTGIAFRTGDGARGWPEEAPFDAILVTAAPGDVPEALLSQLRDGGRMVIPVGRGNQDLVLVRKRGETIQRENLMPVRFVPLIGGPEEDP